MGAAPPRRRTGSGSKDGIEAVVRGAESAAARTGTVVRLIATALRSHDPADNVRLAEAASRFRDRGLTGWDLAGPEAAFPDPLLHGDAFEAARAGGLRITVHAGEWGGAAQVRRALEVNPERIAHGEPAADDPALVAELTSRGVCLDLCPTSNVQTGYVPSLAAHRIGALHRAGAPVTLSTDDTTVSDVTLTEEYARAVAEIGLTLPELWAIDRFALDVAFADEATLAPLRAEFDAWAAGIPELHPRAEGGRLSRRRASLQHLSQLLGVRGDGIRPIRARERLEGRARRHAGEHQDRPRAHGVRRGEVRDDPVADHDRLLGVAPDRVRRFLHEQRLGLADHDRGYAGRDLDRGDDAPGAGPEADARPGRPGRGSWR